MAIDDIAQSLAQARRTARLAGRPLSKQEAAGIAQGFSAENRAAAIQEKGLKQQQEQFAADLALRTKEQNELLKAAKGTAAGAVASTGVGVLGGALVGGEIGAAGGPIGAGIGAVLGGIAGLAREASKGCMIVTACTYADSYEVNVARAYRDHVLGPLTKAGYYILAPLVSEKVNKYSLVKFLVKRVIVDRLVDYGEYAMGWKDNLKYKSSVFVKTAFLGLCYKLGEFKMKTEGKEIIDAT